MDKVNDLLRKFLSPESMNKVKILEVFEDKYSINGDEYLFIFESEENKFYSLVFSRGKTVYLLDIFKFNFNINNTLEYNLYNIVGSLIDKKISIGFEEHASFLKDYILKESKYRIKYLIKQK